MHPDRGIVRTDIWSDVICIIIDDSNTLTRQSAGTNNAPREPLHDLITPPPPLGSPPYQSL